VRQELMEPLVLLEQHSLAVVAVVAVTRHQQESTAPAAPVLLTIFGLKLPIPRPRGRVAAAAARAVTGRQLLPGLAGLAAFMVGVVVV
jgi:hypothetical protein